MPDITDIKDLMEIDGFDDLDKIIALLPEPAKVALGKLREGYRIFRLFMPIIPKKYRGKIASVESRQIVTAFKLAEKVTGKNWDNEVIRTALKNIFIGLYDLDEDWLPKWPLIPED